MSYLNYDGLAYFKSKLTNWVDQNYLSKTSTGNLTVAGNVTFTNPVTGDLDGKAKKDWLGQKIDETYIKSIATNDNAGTIVYTKGNGSTNHILIDILQGATPIANGRAGLVPAPTVSEMNYFLRGDGNWAVPTDVYVNQNLIASSNNNQFPVLLSGTSGTPATKTNATVGYTNVVSVNPLTNALMASQFISKHPTYNRQSAVTSKVQYSLNFTDIVSGAGHNLGEVVGYVDTVANGGEHELGLRLFGNPNVQGTEEDYVYMGVGLSNTNVAYGHAPSTPLPSAHNEPTDIITRDWLSRNGSETGLVHTSMNETIDGTKTFVKKIVANDGMNATGNIAADTLTIRQDATIGRDLAVTRNETVGGTFTTTGKLTANGTAEIKGGSGNTPSLTVTGNEYISGNSNIHGNLDVDGNANIDGTTTLDGNVHMLHNLDVDGNANIDGNETVVGNISTTNGNIATTNGTVSGKTGSIGSGGLTVTGPTNLNGGASVSGGSGLSITGNETVNGTLTVGGKITGNSGAAISGGNGLQVTGNETISGNLTVGGTTTTEDLTVNDDATIGDDLIVNGDVSVAGTINKKSGNTTKEYVTYVTEQPDTRQNIAANLIDTTKGLKLFGTGSNVKIGVNAGPGLALMDDGNSSVKKLYVNFSEFLNSDNPEIRSAFEELLSALHLQLYVGENGIGTNFYVDYTNGINKTEDGYGRSENKPWKTIAYATQMLGKNYNISNKEVVINVSGGTYTDPIALPLLQRTTGKVYIRPKTANDVVNIEWTCVSSGASTISHSGGSWVIDNCNIKIILAEQTSALYYYPHLVNSTDNTGGVTLRSCNFSFVDNTVPVDSTHGLCEARLICASSGNIQISNDGFYSDHSTTAGRTTTWSGTKTNANILWIHGEFGGNVTFWNGGQEYNLPYTYAVSGKWTRFANLLSKSQITSNGVGPHAVFSYNIAEIGRGSQGYYISGGASASTGTNSVEARENYFPRGYITTEGSDTPVSNYCDASQFSYISPTS